MIALNEYIEESLLGGFEEIEASADPKEDIIQFIKDNYQIGGHLYISDKPNKEGKYEVSCGSAIVINKDIIALTNGMFEWDEITNVFQGDFSCYGCDSLISLEGAPKKVRGDFSCAKCYSLTSLEGVPEEVGGNFSCYKCDSLTSLEGVPKKVGGDFSCGCCENLTSLKGAPKEVGGYFNCSHCNSLTSLEGAPKKVGGHFSCIKCKKRFTTKDVRKVSNVRYKIST